jgi:exosome complex component RRP45
MFSLYVKKGLEEGLREDGRGMNDTRKIKISLGPDMGTSLVQLGSTKAFAHVSCEIVRPSASSSTEGSITINAEYSSMATPTIDGDKYSNSEREVNLSRMLEKMLRKSRAIDTEGLCIIAGEKVLSRLYFKK